MSWINNISVRLKVMGIATLALLGFVGFLSWNYYIAEQARFELQGIQNNDFPALRLINNSGTDASIMQETLTSAMQEKDADLLTTASNTATQIDTSLQQAVKIMPAMQADTGKLLQDFRQYNQYAESLANDTIAGTVNAEDQQNRLRVLNELRSAFDKQLEWTRHQLYLSFNTKLQDVQARSETAWQLGLGVVMSVLMLIVTSVVISRTILRPLQYAMDAANKIASGDWAISIAYTGRDELGRMLNAIQRMRDRLKNRFDEDRRAERIKTVVAELSTRMRGEHTTEQLADHVLTYLVPALNAQVGLFYIYRDDALHLLGSYAFTKRKNLANKFALGESLVGQAALEKKQIMLTGVPDDYIAVSSGLGESVPRNILVTPILHEGELRAVLEIGSLHSLEAVDMEILAIAVDHIAIALTSSMSRLQLREMLRQTQQQADLLQKQQETMQSINEDLEGQAIALSASEMKLQQQQEELRRANEELEEQAQALRASEESLQAQQEELRVINEELEAQAKLLAEQRNELLEKNERLNESQEVLQEKTRQLEMSSKYKSEFLSTMSHELRTPLNSILILSNSLADNKPGNLTEKQIEHAKVIHSAGADLLSLINDILDISKVEEGKMELVIESLSLTDLADHLRRNFDHVAQHKGIEFGVDLMPGIPPAIYTDRQRLEQVLRNFFSNAFKFTQHGSVRLRIALAPADTRFNRIQPAQGPILALSVIDTGIGVPKDKQQIIFEAFQQADGTTSRKYGGTGLGLTISREFSHLLGGEVHLHSDGEGLGSTFTLYLPVGAVSSASAGPETSQAMGALNDTMPSFASATAAAAAAVQRPKGGGRKTLLIIEDDNDFSDILAELAEEYHFRSLQAHDGERGLEMAKQLRPDAIILDIGLPGIDGWDVLEALKADPGTHDIPVHCFSGRDERAKALSMGALAYYRKPATPDQIKDAFGRIEERLERHVRRLLVVEDNSVQHSAIHELFDNGQVDVTVCTTGQEALDMLRRETYDCMVLDLSLPDIDGYSMLEHIHEDDAYPALPVIVYTARDLTREQEARLRKYADRIILKTDQSAERLLSEASLFLHWVESANGSLNAKGRPSEISGHRDDVFSGKRVLLVDDDMRNIYALSASLEEWGCEILLANNGRESLEMLDANPDTDIVLMDIMMPEMDGYEAMQKIRAQERFKKLPMLALTAKAMRDDRAKCLEAGANDYISKPVDVEKLQSLMRVWLQRS
jgi:CheY-like chemotaxis protein/HAMP domain-containing protein